MKRNRKSRSAGFTALEIAIASMVMCAVMGVGVAVAGSSSRAMRDCALRADLDARVQSTLERITHDLTTTSLGSLGAFPASPSWDSDLDYGRIASVDPANGVATWTPCRFQLDLDDGETADGTDQNRNRLVDERAIVAVENRGTGSERRVVVTRFVRALLAGETANGMDDNGNGLIDEEGLCFERNGRQLTIRITLERADADGKLVTRTAETTVALRN